jgi:hypothetical protein
MVAAVRRVLWLGSDMVFKQSSGRGDDLGSEGLAVHQRGLNEHPPSGQRANADLIGCALVLMVTRTWRLPP